MASHTPRVVLERYILAALVAAEVGVAQLIAKFGLTDDDFSVIWTKDIFKTICDISKIGEIDFAILYSHATPECKDAVNLLPFNDAVTALLPQYVDELRKHRVKDLVYELVQSGADDPMQFKEKLEIEFNKIVKQDRELEPISSIIKRVFKTIEKACERCGELTGVPSGLSDVDNLTWGFQPRRLYLLAGRPSMGKSALAFNFAIACAKAGKHAYIHSLEESKHSIVCRIISYFAEVHNEKISKGQLETADWSKIAKAADEISKLLITINDKTGMTSAGICQDILHQNSKRKIDLIIIDHIQEIYDEAQNRHLAISKACSNFRSLAKSLEVPVIILCQLSRNVESRQNKQPMMSDLKESGDLEAQADMVMLLYRDSYYSKDYSDESVNLFIAKNRDGRTGQIDLMWKRQFLKFENKKTY